METYTDLKDLTENPDYGARRRDALEGLKGVEIDSPIIEHVNGLNSLPWCFTLQSCYGHFLYKGQDNPYNIEPLPITDSIDRVDYKIAYIALCIENSDAGRRLFEDLKTLTRIDPENVQFCCAEWFWERQVNSYALQVEPDRFKHEDRVELDYREALKIEKIRNEFFIRLKDLIKRHMTIVV
ncbi:MAG: hypothetical protein JW944_08115 [Deltaproteobacteria bacterium]|nr:hypothetical protein [Deltaproteobacteria bacterium]